MTQNYASGKQRTVEPNQVRLRLELCIKWLIKVVEEEWQCFRDPLEYCFLKLIFAVLSFFYYKEIAYMFFLFLDRLYEGKINIVHSYHIITKGPIFS